LKHTISARTGSDAPYHFVGIRVIRGLMKISLGSDHAGFRYKEKVKELLRSLGHEVKDCGTFSEEPVDYPLFIRPRRKQ